MNRTVSLLAAVAAAGFLAACGKPEPVAPKAEPAAPKPAEVLKVEPLKVGFVYVSPVGDAGWTSQHNAGRLANGEGARRQGEDELR